MTEEVFRGAVAGIDYSQVMLWFVYSSRRKICQVPVEH